MLTKFTFVTDTATMCIFDLESLKHRIDDDADWWSINSEELSEMNLGNVAFIDLGSDGKYHVVIDQMKNVEQVIEFNIKCTSGRFFLGAGEEVTSEGLEPECVRGGTFLEVEPANYSFRLQRQSSNELMIEILKTSIGSNNFSLIPSLISR